MPTQRTTFSVSCPVCERTHCYGLRVERALSMQVGQSAKVEQLEFTRLVVCPVKNQDFQLTVSLEQTPESRIEAIEMVLENQQP